MKKVGENPKYLEDMTGLTDLLNDTSLMDGVIGRWPHRPPERQKPHGRCEFFLSSGFRSALCISDLNESNVIINVGMKHAVTYLSGSKLYTFYTRTCFLLKFVKCSAEFCIVSF